MKDRFLKRLRKKAKKGMRGWPIATVAFYGPSLSQATKVVVSIVPSENAEPQELRDWKLVVGDVRSDPAIAEEILAFIELHGVLSIVMTDGIIGCPHQEGIDYEGEWCPVCEFWHGRDRFTGQRVH
jgi:hypothetical protein